MMYIGMIAENGIVPTNEIVMNKTVSIDSAAREDKSLRFAKPFSPSLCLRAWKMTSFAQPARIALIIEPTITLTEVLNTVKIELLSSRTKGISAGLIKVQIPNTNPMNKRFTNVAIQDT